MKTLLLVLSLGIASLPAQAPVVSGLTGNQRTDLVAQYEEEAEVYFLWAEYYAYTNVDYAYFVGHGLAMLRAAHELRNH